LVKISICPKCKSPDIRLSNSAAGMFLPEQWVCDKCGYEGYMILEIDVKDKEKSSYEKH